MEKMEDGKPVSAQRLDRATVLKLAAATGIAAVLGDGLLTAAPWLDYEKQVRETWYTPFQTAGDLVAQQREWVRYATLAPSGHNTQPWRFTLQRSTIRLAPDYNRRLPAVDPQNRELWISLGCALENLVIAADTSGYAADITYPNPDADYISVRFRSASPSGSPSLQGAIPNRQSNRSIYSGQSLSARYWKQLDTMAQGVGVSLRIVTNTREKEAILEYISEGNRLQFTDPTFLAELISWLRFNKPEALRSLDGLYAVCAGKPNVPRWLGKRFMTPDSAGGQSKTDATAVRSSAGLIVLLADQDDTRHWIDLGRLYERLALTLTSLGIQMAFVNQPVEVPVLRSQFQSYLDVGTALPQLLMRIGYASPMPRSLRRPLTEVLA